MSNDNNEKQACRPTPVEINGFNRDAVIPYGCTIEHLRCAMQEFLDFLGFVNCRLHTRQIPRLESLLMPANFSSVVGEFMTATIPKHCSTLVRNLYHNGHPDLLPKGYFESDSVLHADHGIEVKASRYPSGWQGHNPEEVWLMVFVFEANSPRDIVNQKTPKPFRFLKVVGAQLVKEDWAFSGRSSTSRRTITASVIKSGFQKMEANWIYRHP